MSRQRVVLARVLGWLYVLLIGVALGLALPLRPLSQTAPVAPPLTLVSAPAVRTRLRDARPEVTLERHPAPARLDERRPSASQGPAELALPETQRPRRVSLPPGAPRAQSRSVITHVNTAQKLLALTFDFDMTPNMLARLQTGRVQAWYDPEVLATLSRQNVPATIFVTGLAAVAYPALVRELAHDPLFELGNHSNRHFAFAPHCFTLPTLADREDQDDVEAAQQNIELAAGVSPQYFRFPGGCYESRDVALITQLGFTIIQWDVESGDAFNRNRAAIVRRVLAQAHSGSIVVFHLGGPNAPETAAALKVVIPALRAQGYTFMTISQLLALVP